MNDQFRTGPTLLESMWRYRGTVFLATVLMGLAGYGLSLLQDEVYDASSTIFLDNPSATGVGGIVERQFVDIEDYVPQQASLLTSRVVLTSAAEQLEDGTTLDDLDESLQISAQAQNLQIAVQASASDPDQAAARANAVVAAFADNQQSNARQQADDAVRSLEEQAAILRQSLAEAEESLDANPESQVLVGRIATLSNQLEAVEAQVRSVRLEFDIKGDGIRLVESALTPEFPSAPQPRINAIIFAFLGGLVSSMWAYWYAVRSQRATNRSDPEGVLGVPLLGEIPQYRQSSGTPLQRILNIDPAASESYEFVLSSIEYAMKDVGATSLLVTSTLPGDGKTTTALQLAIAASRDQRRVMLVDADIRARGLTSVLGASDRKGLSDLAASVDLEPSETTRRYRFNERSTIPILTAGTRRGDAAAMLRTHAVRRTIQAVAAQAELLIVDASPILAVADATIVSGHVDAMVLVVSNGTPISELEKIRDRLKFISTPLLGYIFNRSGSMTAGAYGYGYGLEEDDEGHGRLVPKGGLSEDVKKNQRKADERAEDRRPEDDAA